MQFYGLIGVPQQRVDVTGYMFAGNICYMPDLLRFQIAQEFFANVPIVILGHLGVFFL